MRTFYVDEDGEGVGGSKTRQKKATRQEGNKATGEQGRTRKQLIGLDTKGYAGSREGRRYKWTIQTRGRRKDSRSGEVSCMEGL